ncbi:hypothetical protein [Micromonospora sp. CPCC 206061]|uniref:hypothetical protein n=1 Tax=Micromonospora sp. CPCC 206061 TaxID=3122410 RepID=UPI002FEE9789
MELTAVWALLLTAGLVILALVAFAAVAERPRTPRPDPRKLRAAAQELAVHANKAHTEAGRAAGAAADARERLAEAERARDEAWAAQEAADQTYRRAWQEVLAGRAAQDSRVADPVEGADEQQRDVARAALTAYRNGDISVEQLREVWLRASGDWDPELEERERAAYRYKLEERAARRVYHRADVAVRHAEQEVQVAEVALQALRDEAAEAAVEAHEALLATERYTQRRRLPRPRPRTE